MAKTPGDRFRAKVAVDDTGCHLWTAAKDKDGYGQYRVGKRIRQAHIYAWEQESGGELPEGYEIDHVCRRRHCVNPHHLELVTHAENIRRQQEAQALLKDKEDEDKSERTLQRQQKKRRDDAAVRLAEMIRPYRGALESRLLGISERVASDPSLGTDASVLAETGAIVRAMSLVSTVEGLELIPPANRAFTFGKLHEFTEDVGGSHAAIREFVVNLGLRVTD